MKYSKFYDIDLPFGEIYEEQLKEFYEGKNIEVKTERDIWKSTGNHAVEFRCRGKLSGISTTKADYWGIVLTLDNKAVMFYIIPVEELKKITRKHYHLNNIVSGGDDNASEMVLVPLKEIATYCL